MGDVEQHGVLVQPHEKPIQPLFVPLAAARRVHAQAAPKAVDFTPIEAVVKKELADTNVPGAARRHRAG
ncbi:MAG: hypothetical protein U0792_14045 [Gemmataceae bacterium]